MNRFAWRAAALLASLAILLLWALPAFADNCDLKINPQDCQNTAWTVGSIATTAATASGIAAVVAARAARNGSGGPKPTGRDGGTPPSDAGARGTGSGTHAAAGDAGPGAGPVAPEDQVRFVDTMHEQYTRAIDEAQRAARDAAGRATSEGGPAEAYDEEFYNSQRRDLEAWYREQRPIAVANREFENQQRATAEEEEEREEREVRAAQQRAEHDRLTPEEQARADRGPEPGSAEARAVAHDDEPRSTTHRGRASHGQDDWGDDDADRSGGRSGGERRGVEARAEDLQQPDTGEGEEVGTGASDSDRDKDSDLDPG